MLLTLLELKQTETKFNLIQWKWTDLMTMTSSVILFDPRMLDLSSNMKLKLC